MIETYNNIIFWIGYLAIISISLVLILSSFYRLHEELMLNSKSYFSFIFNNALKKRLKKISKDDLLKWQESQLKEWEKYNRENQNNI